MSFIGEGFDQSFLMDIPRLVCGSFPGIKFDSGIAPTLSTGFDDVDRIAFDLINDGVTTTEYGHVLGLDMQ